MMKPTPPALTEQFAIEVKENLQRMEQALMQLQQTPTDPELIRELFRACHGIKGIAGYVDAEEIGLLSHEAETLLNQIQREGKPLTTERIGLMLDCHDQLHQMLASFRAQEPVTPSWQEVLTRFQADHQAAPSEPASGSLSTASTKTEVTPGASSPPASISTSPGASEAVASEAVAPEAKAPAPPGNQTSLSMTLSAALTPPLTIPPPTGTPTASTEAVNIVGQQLSGLAIFFEKWKAGPLPLPQRQAIKRKLSLIKKSTSQHPEIISLLDTSLQQLEQQTVWSTQEIDAFRGRLATIPALLAPPAPVKQMEDFAPDQGLSVSVRSSRLHQLSTQVAEMTVIHNQLEYQLEQMSKLHPGMESELRPLRQEWSRVIQSIEKTTQSLHMVQLKELFDRVPRIVRQLAKEIGKRVELTIRGAHTEVDRATVSRLGDPVTHIIRNAIDHGLETPEERIKQGKSATSTISIDAYAVGKSVFVDIFDDGRGIDTLKIKQKAIEKGFITQSQAIRMAETELLDLIFAPGFSSKEQVTEVSGRGVGMDAVKKRLHELNGDVQVRSEVGRGTMMRLTFPNTYTLVKSLLLRCDEQLFALPIQYAQETLHIRPQQVVSLQGHTWIRWKGTLRPLFDLEEILALPLNPHAAQRKHAIRLGVDEREILIRIDQLVDTTVLSANSLPLHLQDLEFFSGMTTVGAGKIVFFLHPLAILNKYTKQQRDTGDSG